MYKFALFALMLLSIPAQAVANSKWEILSSVHSASNKPNEEVKLLMESPIEIDGYSVVNEEGESDLQEFLLTHTPGSCAYEQLPPPNQMIHVKMREGTVPNYFGIKIIVHGVLSMGERADSSYELVADSVRPANQF